MTPPVKRKWYWRFDHFWCPACDSSRTYRSRTYDRNERGHHTTVSGCNACTYSM